LRVCSFLHFLLKLLSQNVLLDLTSYCQWVLCYEFYILWYFIMSDISLAMVENLMSCDFIMFETFYFYYCCDFLPEFLIRNSNNLNILNSIHFVNIILDLFGIDVFATSNDHVFFSTYD